MLNSNFQDFKKWIGYLKNEARIWFLKSIIFDTSWFFNDRVKAIFILNFKLKRFSKVRIVNRCILTGRAKSVLRHVRLSRMEFKRIASEGLLPGIKKRAF